MVTLNSIFNPADARREIEKISIKNAIPQSLINFTSENLQKTDSLVRTESTSVKASIQNQSQNLEHSVKGALGKRITETFKSQSETMNLFI